MQIDGSAIGQTQVTSLDMEGGQLIGPDIRAGG